ncbi:MAG TPA: hypothetical protein PKJ99_01460 [Thermoanaerobaculales bacterium]|nr:hypothetical protein [Thermoanaerobaculales bacterium]HPA82680.1 hypothetical protein [Thermoanaerobaculales bacterium]HQL29114.1 hypothetical protein [Thermoanaerobaculales bacterium]HQN95036.1 hypothetical protein [Thermoanaerobaculales bacterium]HQP43179.1 hypothetical protein [Thermoanaerobaculales bacterium]
MDKVTLLEAVRDLAAAGELTEAEVIAAVREADDTRAAEIAERGGRYSKLLYFLGGGVVVIGMVAFIAQVWEELGSLMHVVVTLGSGLAAFVTGVLLTWHGRLGAAGPAFFLIAALVLPVGMAVSLDEAGLDPGKLGLQCLMALVLLAAFLAAYRLFCASSLLVYAIAYGTWAFFAITGFLVGSDPRFAGRAFFEYRTLAVGLAFMVLGWAFSATERDGLTGPLYTFGSLAFLGSALALGGWEPSQSAFWELIFPGLVFGVLYLSVVLRSTALLAFGALFLGAYLTKITGEYFSDSMGWPLALIVLGLLLMGVGFLTFRLKRIADSG